MLLQLFTDVSNVLTDSLTNDLSANKNAQQYKTPIGCATCTAINVVDRNAQTCARMENIGITSLDKSTWWHVDLGVDTMCTILGYSLRTMDRYIVSIQSMERFTCTVNGQKEIYVYVIYTI